MFKKLPLKNIIIVSGAMLVIPVLAFAMTMTANPIDGSNDKNSNIKITSDEDLTDAATSATGKVQTGQSISTDAISSATGNPATTGQGTSADAVSSATGNPGTTGSIADAVSSATGAPGATGGIEYDDDEYEYDDEEDEEEDD